MATGGEDFNPAYETFRKHSADLLTVIQDPEVLAWELYSKNVVTSTVVEFANNMLHGRGTRTSNLLMAVDSRIAVDPGVFDVFLSVLDRRPSISDLCGRMNSSRKSSAYEGGRCWEVSSLITCSNVMQLMSGRQKVDTSGVKPDHYNSQTLHSSARGSHSYVLCRSICDLNQI